jgi:hypothetical protein
MKLKKRVVIFLGVIHGLGFFSCQETSKEWTTLSFSTVSQGKISEFIDEIEYVILDHPLNSISQVDKVVISENNIFLADIYGFQNIARFNNEGKYLNSIGTYGDGPGQFRQYSDFGINTDGKFVIVLVNGKLLEYELNGGIINENRLAVNPYKFISMDQGKFYFYYPEAMNLGQNSRNDNSILAEVDLGKQTELPVFSPVFPKKFNFMGEKNNLFRYKESLGFSTSFCDTIYFFSKSKLTNKVVLDFGKDKVNMESLYNLPIQELVQKVNSSSYLSKKIHFPNIFYNERFLVSAIRHLNKIDFWVYDILNEKILINSKLYNDLDGGPDFGVVKWMDDQYIYSFFQPEELLELIDKHGNGISRNFKKLSKELTRDNFLVLVKYKLKK